tara:strand:- start:285 stop:650 length:366 start_codon:yes stop_codon:yes gene_type:complete
MKLVLIILSIVLILYLVYKNTKIVEGNNIGRGICSRKKFNEMITVCKKKKKKKKKLRCMTRIAKRCRLYVAYDGDKYKSCKKCCNDDDGCYDSRCFRKCSPESFKHPSGIRKKGPRRRNRN